MTLYRPSYRLVRVQIFNVDDHFREVTKMVERRVAFNEKKIAKSTPTLPKQQDRLVTFTINNETL